MLGVGGVILETVSHAPVLGLFLPRVLQARARTSALLVCGRHCTLAVLPMLQVQLHSKRQALFLIFQASALCSVLPSRFISIGKGMTRCLVPSRELYNYEVLGGCRWRGGLRQWAPSWTSGSPERMAASLRQSAEVWCETLLALFCCEAQICWPCSAVRQIYLIRAWCLAAEAGPGLIAFCCEHMFCKW